MILGRLARDYFIYLIHEEFTMKNDETTHEIIERIVKECNNFTTLEEAEKEMTSWNKIKEINMIPTTSFVIGALSVGQESSKLTELIVERIMRTISPYEFIGMVTITCSESDTEREALGELSKVFQQLIERSVISDPYIINIRDELKVIWRNLT